MTAQNVREPNHCRLKLRRSFKGVMVLIATAIVLVGCARDPLEEAAWQASRIGTAAGEGRRGLDTVALETGSRVVERFYAVAKYQASAEQRRLAEASALRAAPKFSKRAAAAGQKAPRYLAVRTKSDQRAKTATNVMIWDTSSQRIVGNNVYDVDSKPAIGALVRFDTYSAPYVGIGE